MIKYFHNLVTEKCTYDIFNIVKDEICMFIFTTEKCKVLHLGESDHLPENSMRTKGLKNSLAEKYLSVTADTKLRASPKCNFHCRFIA